MLTVIPGSAGPAAVEAAALYAASGRLVDVHGILHDNWHLGFQLCIPDALLEEPWWQEGEVDCVFLWACPSPPKYWLGPAGDMLIYPLWNIFCSSNYNL